MRVFSSKMYGSGIRGDDDRPFRQFSAEFLTQGWYCRQIIDRNMEEPSICAAWRSTART